MPTCLIDQTEHVSLAALHKHLRKLKVKQVDYYTLYHKRYDLYTHEPIPFKDAAQYLSTEFLTKHNLRCWIAANPEEGREWAIEWLARRKEEKGLTHPPTQVELSSLMCPTIRYYDFIGGYTPLCGVLGYTIRFDGNQLAIHDVSDSDCIIDTREQQALSIDGIRAKLNVGDYGLIPEKDIGVYIERKSLADFIGTLSLGYDRFVREIERAKEVGAYLVILVECPLSEALQHKPKHSMVNMAHVFKNLRDILSRSKHVQALFVGDRDEAAESVRVLLSAGDSVKHVDLQYLYERGGLLS